VCRIVKSIGCGVGVGVGVEVGVGRGVGISVTEVQLKATMVKEIVIRNLFSIISSPPPHP
jgi:hypothetical protein